MKIDQSAGSAIPLPVAKTPSPAPSVAVDRLKGTAPATGQVHRLASPAAGSDFDAARVAAIREDIRAGRYQVHPERIADGLLASVRDLIARGKNS